MRSKKIYSSDTLNNLRATTTKFIEERKKEVTLDTVLLQSKKEAAELIKIGCNPKEIAKIYKSAGIQVSLAKIKQAYFANIKKRPRCNSKISKSQTHQS